MRIGQVLDHRLVDFGFFAGEHQFDVLAQAARQITGNARVLLEQPADRLHAGLHDRVLQIRHQQVELADRLIERVQGLGIGATVEDVRAQRIQAILGQANFTREIQHLIEAGGIDANRVVARLFVVAATDRVPDNPACPKRGGRWRPE